MPRIINTNNMVKGKEYILKQPNSSQDYKRAYNIVSSINIGDCITIEVDKLKRFRKYLYELGYQRNQEFATRKRGDIYINVTRIS